MTLRRMIAGVAMAGLLTPLAASAQPDPFADHEEGRRGGATDAPLPGGDARVMTTAGGVIVGLTGVFGYTRSAGEGFDGGERIDTTFFTRFSPSVGFMLLDRLELAFAPGLAWRRVQRGESETTTERAVLFRVATRYQAPLGSKVLGVVGVELGGYVGGSERPLEPALGEAASGVDEATDTAGFTAALELGLGFVLDPKTVLDAGFTLDYLTGSEEISSQSASLASSLLHTGLRLGLRFFF